MAAGLKRIPLAPLLLVAGLVLFAAGVIGLALTLPWPMGLMLIGAVMVAFGLGVSR